MKDEINVESEYNKTIQAPGVNRMREQLRRLFPQYWRDWIILTLTISTALALSLLLQPVGADASHASLFYVLAVLVVSRYTGGYLYGTLASIISVLVVNYAFVYPYYAFDINMAGFPLTFATMFTVSITVSTLAAHLKKQEEIRISAERERLRANLLRAVGHDLRTPLTSIIGSASAILENEDTLGEEEKHTLLLNVKSESEWMIDMVENLLSITKVGGDPSYRIRKTPQAPEEILSEVVDKVTKRFSWVQVEVMVPETWLEVPMDAMLIEQVLFNLMENSITHGKATRIVAGVESSEQWARFSVSDNGPGLPEERFRHLQGDYMQMADTGGSDKKRNLGIGLLVCRDIVKVHGGELIARNRPEGGAQVTFSLPLKEEERGNEGEDSRH